MPPLRPEWAIGPEQAEQFLRSRRSIHSYEDQAVDQATLQQLIEVARHAPPSGHNRQPVHWLAISGRDKLNQLCELGDSMDALDARGAAPGGRQHAH